MPSVRGGRRLGRLGGGRCALRLLHGPHIVATHAAALAAHASQVQDGIRYFQDEPEREAREAGAKIGVEHAEAFRVLNLS